MNKKEIILHPNYLIKYVNIIDNKGNPISYSYTPLYKFKYTTQLLINKNQNIIIEPMLDIQNIYNYTLANNFELILGAKLNIEYLYNNKIKTNIKNIIDDNENIEMKNNNNNQIDKKNKQGKTYHYNNLLDLQVKIIEIISKNMYFYIKPDVQKIKTSYENLHNIYQLNTNDGFNYIDIKNVSITPNTNKTIFYKIIYDDIINIAGFILF